MATVLVIDASASVRETLRIVLGHEHEVVVAPTLDEVPAHRAPDVVVLGLPAPRRDLRALGTTLARIAAETPLLLLHAANDVDVGALVPPQVPVEFLPKPFDAYGVRVRVRALLAARTAAPVAAERIEAHRRFLEFPFLTHASAAVMRRVVTADVPIVLLQGEPGTGAGAVARALHVMRNRHGGFVTVDAATLAEGELAKRLGAGGGRAIGTVHLANLDRASSEVQAELLAMLESRQPSSLRIVAGVGADLGELAASGRFLPDLYYLVSTVPVLLSPLRDRAEDVVPLVEAMTRTIAARLQIGAVTYSAAALERLRLYLWFGNVAELEAVLSRTLTLHPSGTVEADQLIFLSEDVPRAVASRSGTTPSPVAQSDALAGLDLEVVLNELAHELRNPMVTIKTFAQHLDSVLADPESRARFSELTTDAIGRMDGLLETLLDFSRFGPPSPQSIDVQAILDRALAEQADELARRHVTIERNGVGVGRVSADEAQVLFALRCLCRGLVANLVAHTPIKVRGAEPGVLELQARADASVATRLAALVEPRVNGSAAENPPLAWALAAALLRRNGGMLTVSQGDAGSMVVRVGWSRPGA